VARAFQSKKQTNSFACGHRNVGFVRDLGHADNLLNEEIRDHTSLLKEVALLAGCSFSLGARMEF